MYGEIRSSTTDLATEATDKTEVLNPKYKSKI